MEFDWLRDEVDLLKDVGQLPAHVERHRTRAIALFYLFLAALFIFGFVVNALDVLSAGRLITLLITGPLGMVFLLIGICRLISRYEYAFTSEAVRCRRRGLVRRREWTEPMSGYRGVLATEEPALLSANWRILTLKHRDRRQLDVMLYRRIALPSLGGRHERYARLLGLPALTRTVDGWAERSPADLNKSVHQRVAEGTLAVSFDPASGPPGRGLSVSIEGDALTLRSRPSLAWTLFYGPASLLGLASLLAGPLGGLATDFIRRASGAALAAVCGAVVCWQSLAREELLVSPRELRRRLLVGGLPIAGSALSTDEIQEVVVTPTPGNARTGRVEVIADRAAVRFGMMLSKAQRHWVRDCTIAVISK